MSEITQDDLEALEKCDCGHDFFEHERTGCMHTDFWESDADEMVFCECKEFFGIDTTDAAIRNLAALVRRKQAEALQEVSWSWESGGEHELIARTGGTATSRSTARVVYEWLLDRAFEIERGEG